MVVRGPEHRPNLDRVVDCVVAVEVVRASNNNKNNKNYTKKQQTWSAL